MPKLYIIAGPNGAGKTTFAKEFLPHYAKCSNFVNADLIAMGLSPFAPGMVNIKAGKLLLSQIQSFMDDRLDFAFESTLSGKTYINLIKEAKSQEYSIHIFFLWIPDLGLARERIKQRVKQGGHDVPFEDVKRRLYRSLKNFFNLYLESADEWNIFDNSGARPVLIAKQIDKELEIVDKSLYQHLLKVGGRNE